MFSNVWSKIKVLAYLNFIFGALGSLVMAAQFGVRYDYLGNSNFDGSFLVILLVGIALSYISSILIYGFGELIERVKTVEEKMSEPKKSEANIIEEALKF